MAKFLKYKTKLRIQSLFAGWKPKQAIGRPKILFAASVCRNNLHLIKKVIDRFTEVDCHFIFFQWDDLEPIEFSDSSHIEVAQVPKSKKWQVLKRYITPEKTLGYDFIFTWDDDIDIGQFSPKRYLDIVMNSKLEVSQPALTHQSVHFHPITVQNENFEMGRLTDFVEIMIPVFTRQAWKKFWNMIERDWNHWGWGYDEFMVSVCKFKRIGIIDCEPVTHIKELGFPKEAFIDHKKFRLRHQRMKESEKIHYAPISC